MDYNEKGARKECSHSAHHFSPIVLRTRVSKLTACSTLQVWKKAKKQQSLHPARDRMNAAHDFDRGAAKEKSCYQKQME